MEATNGNSGSHIASNSDNRREVASKETNENHSNRNEREIRGDNENGNRSPTEENYIAINENDNRTSNEAEIKDIISTHIPESVNRHSASMETNETRSTALDYPRENRERSAANSPADNNETISNTMDYHQSNSPSVADTNSTTIDIVASTNNTTYDIHDNIKSSANSTPIQEIIADLSRVNDEIMNMSAATNNKAETILTQDVGTSVDISEIPTDEEEGDTDTEDKLNESDCDKCIDSDMVQLIGTDMETDDEQFKFMNVSANDTIDKKIIAKFDEIATDDDLDSVALKLTEANFRDVRNESTVSPPFTYHTSDDSHFPLNDNTYSDGYFNASIDKLYKDRNEKSEEYCRKEDSEEGNENVGCFDTREADQGKPFLFSRCGKKKLAIISTIGVVVTFAVAAALLITVNALSDHHHHHGRMEIPKAEEFYEHAAVASDSARCSKIGADILRKNGSAVDAAIAAGFCMSVDNMYASGIGGGGFIVIYIRENKTFEALDFREVAPGRARSDMFEGSNDTSKYGGKAIGVPGEVKGFQDAWKKYGVLPWKDLVQPAIDMARNGVPLPQRLYDMVTRFKYLIQEDTGLRKLLLSRNGKALDVNFNLTNVKLAATLEAIRDNPDDFYFGNLAEKIVKDVVQVGGIISLDDLANYQVKKRDVISIHVNALKFNSMGAPSGGPVIAQIINILKGYKFTREDIETTDTDRVALTYHRIIEAIKFALAHKALEVDPDFADKDEIGELIRNMTDERIGELFRQRIDDDHTQEASFYGADDATQDQGTSHISILAPNGDAVSMTTSINEQFGNMYRSPDTGIIYNNEMDDFSKKRPYSDVFQSLHNTVHGGKRPRSSMSPIIFTNKVGDVKFVIGGVGGVKILSAVSEVILYKLTFGDTLAQAIARPRVHHMLQPDEVIPEGGYQTNISDDVLKALAGREHTVVNPTYRSAVNAIYVNDSGNIEAMSDFLKGAHSSGF